ncbi:MAG TPA: sigma 54-interacting transcriptional regulator, partial [Bryobacteraceae bacterium]|nr:sigma 54-interacting transcriptional regulator [Bryobacteraceae bacterium]
EDQKRVRELFERSEIEKTDYEADYRIVLPNGAIKHLHAIGRPVLNESGELVEFIGTVLDITERKNAERQLRRSEACLAGAQRLSHTGSFGWSIPSGEVFWSEETFRIFQYDQTTKPTPEVVFQRVHPEDVARVKQTVERASQDGKDFEHEHRLLMPDGSVKHVHAVAHGSLDKSGGIEFVGAISDITPRKRAEEALRKSEERWRSVFENSAVGVTLTDMNGRFLATNHVYQTMLGYTEEELCALHFLDITHEDYREANCALVTELMEGKRRQFQIEKKCRRKDGSLIWVSNNVSLVPGTDRVPRFLMTLTEDITERKQAEDKVREQEVELRQILDAAPQHLSVLSSDGSHLYINQSSLDFLGLTLEEWQRSDIRGLVHPDDAERVARERKQALSRGSPLEIEMRLRRHDGEYRWLFLHYKPLKDHLGRITRWVVPAIDIDDRKRAEERTRNENLALREQIDRDSMFEDVVGSSEALRKMLSRVSKVAPSDSTVLILGETGTGKELIARAIHKRSNRAERAFIGVNCAAIPSSLVASELFGYEKGAFTGATQRHLGRFELAHGGTIFLDEVGDLPPEIQIALLRVLQEREIERVGGNKPIPVDVRVLSATHRDLNALVAEGKFRRDLLYRLNVVPIEMPSLRERAADIPLLVEYFVDRFGKKAGKKFRTIDTKTLRVLQVYRWPGNIRELQNVIERAVILSDGDTFSVDDTWLKQESPQVAGPTVPLGGALLSQEKEMIESALAESRGRISGPAGAAAKLALPPQTLESKIKRWGINKVRFKYPHAG